MLKMNNNIKLDCSKLTAPTSGAMTFYVGGNIEILKFEHNGDIFVKGKLVENDKEVVTALREFLQDQHRL